MLVQISHCYQSPFLKWLYKVVISVMAVFVCLSIPFLLEKATGHDCISYFIIAGLSMIACQVGIWVK